ncbi:hypothetical protein PRIPAC_85338 [Pristionchus pacificus]|uniref:G protein-coupled receptor n=1 Tax=Pristionchus pacificus TaxID=54126 RepID=A0A2A6BT01_PRIPA|nr:hypothetical protein PRIPAC_85338 [Pristionchus pacificus]|eukprot:PDM69069.1 G protein-coupled receptor [Pristionchus pacificus]
MSASMAINPLTNQSVWIPFFIRFHRLPLQLQPYYTVFVACEVIGHIFSLITCLFGLFVFYQVKAFHSNLAQTISNGFYVGPPFILLRIPLILMETGIIKYENYLHGFIYVALACIVNNLAFFLFLYTSNKNEQVQEKLTQFKKSDKSYTVSYRWQLHDNSRSARLRTLMIGCNAIISFILPVLFVPALILDNNPAMSGILEAAKLVYQVNSAFVFGGSYVFVTLIVKKHRDFLFGTSHAGKVSQTVVYPAPTSNRISAETDHHFTRLQKEWGVGGMSSFHAVHPVTNQTFWIPFFIRFHRLPEELQRHYHTFVTFEVGLPFVVLRFPLIFIEIGLIKYETMADDLIVTITFIRTWLFVDVYNFEVNIALERYFALRFVRTYEKVERRYISATIILANSVYSLVLSYLLTYNYLHGFFYIALTCIFNNIALVHRNMLQAFLRFANKNELIRARLIQFKKSDNSYSVSYRWQLHDNARSARELRWLIVVCNGVISLILPAMFVPAFIFDNDPSKSEVLEAAKLLYQVTSAYVFGCCYLFVCFVIKKHRDHVFGVSNAVLLPCFRVLSSGRSNTNRHGEPFHPTANRVEGGPGKEEFGTSRSPDTQPRPTDRDQCLKALVPPIILRALRVSGLMCARDSLRKQRAPYAAVEFTHSTMYSIRDFMGVDEVPLPNCDLGCFIYTATYGDLEPYMMNLVVYDPSLDQNRTLANLALKFDQTTSQKIPLDISVNGSYSIYNLNDPKDTGTEISVWVVERSKALEVDYEIYDALELSMNRGNIPPKDVVTIMSVTKFRVVAQPGGSNSYTARLVGFDNAFPENPDLCAYACQTPLNSNFDGFELHVDGPIVSIVFEKKNNVAMMADYRYAVSGERDMSKEGFIATFYQVYLDAHLELEPEHQINVTDQTTGQMFPLSGNRTNIKLTLDLTQHVIFDYTSLTAPQTFLIRHNAVLKEKATSPPPTTVRTVPTVPTSPTTIPTSTTVKTSTGPTTTTSGAGAATVLAATGSMSSFLAVNPLNNHTVWIPFFIRYDRLPEELQPVYGAFVAAEALGHIFSLIVGTFGIFVYYRVQALHFNLAQTILNAFYTGMPFIMLRFPLILMETGVIKYETMADTSIVIISAIRMWLFVALYNFEVNIAVERYFALQYVRTYEKIRRRYISLIILGSNSLFSMVLAYLLTYNYLHGFFYIALVCIVNNLALVMFLSTAKKNERVQKRLIQFRKNDGSYSVSYRWQLHDNTRSARELRILMIGCNGIITFILPVMFVPALILDNVPSKSELLEAAKLIYQVTSAYIFGISYLYLTFIIKKQRDYVLGLSPVEEFSLALEHSRTDNRVVKDTESHFSRLHGEWGVEIGRVKTERLEITIS